MSPVPPPRPALGRPGALKAAKRAAGAPSATGKAAGKPVPGKNTPDKNAPGKSTPDKGAAGQDAPDKIGPARDDKLVELVVPLPKDVRKRVRDKAELLGVSPEEAVYRVLLSWVEG